MQKLAFHRHYMIRNLLPLIVLVLLSCLLLLYLSYPSCTSRSLAGCSSDSPQLVVMAVGDLHLTGPRTMWLDRVRRDSFMKTSFKRAYQMLKPQALLILGDISDSGRKSTKEQWKEVLERYKDMVSPYEGLPVHVTPGNHDIGDFYQLYPDILQQFVASFPGLDATGSEIFTVKNIPFISLNAMALACNNCPLHGSVRKFVEETKVVLHNRSASLISQTSDSQGSLDSGPSEGSLSQRPVLLLHLPLFRVDERVCQSFDIPRCAPWHEVEGGCLPLLASDQSASAPTPKAYRSMMDMLSQNASNYLLSVLKPRLVLSAHAHRFCNRLHDDGTREITVSTFTWRNRDDPSFLLINLYKDGATDIQQCFLPRESLVLGLHVLQLTLLALVIAVGSIRYRMVRKKSHLKA